MIEGNNKDNLKHEKKILINSFSKSNFNVFFMNLMKILMRNSMNNQ